MVSVPFVNYGGAIGADERVEGALMDEAARIARELGVGHIEFRDTVRRGEAWPVRTDKVEMVLDLPGCTDELARSLGSKVRAQIKRPQRAGASVTWGHLDRLAEFYGVFARNMRDLGTPVYSRRFFEQILSTFEDAAQIVVVSIRGVPVAAGLLLAHRETMEIPWASSMREHNRLGVNMLLYWEALGRAITNGYRRFDFGRSSQDSGTYRFKKQWGAQPLQLYWHYWLRCGDKLPALNPDNPKFRLAIAIWRRLPLALTNRLGPAIVRYLP